MKILLSFLFCLIYLTYFIIDKYNINDPNVKSNFFYLVAKTEINDDFFKTKTKSYIEKSLKYNPNNEQAIEFLLKNYLYKYSDIYDLTQKYYKQFPNNPTIIHKEIERRFAKNELDNIEELIDRLMSQGPDAVILSNIYRNLSLADRFDLANEITEKYKDKIDLTDISLNLELMRENFYRHNFDKSEIHARKILEYAKDDQKWFIQTAYSFLGDIFLERGKIDESLEFYQKTIDINEFFTHGLARIAYIYRLQGRILDSIKFYEKALSLDDSIFFHYQISISYYYNNDYEKALEAIEKCIVKHPEIEEYRKVKDLYLEEMQLASKNNNQ